MEVKIKQGNEMLDATIEMIDGVMVVSPKKVEDISQFKDGDILTGGSEYDGGLCWTFILKKEIENFHNDYKFAEEYVSLDSNGSFEIGSYSDAIKWVRPATEEEKRKLFDRIKEEGYEWKTDTKELVKLKWKPKVGDIYFRPDFNRCMFMCYEGKCRYDTKRYIKDCVEKGWVFRTKEECQEFCKRLNDAISQVKP
jgi:hypothetical protein